MVIQHIKQKAIGILMIGYIAVHALSAHAELLSSDLEHTSKNQKVQIIRQTPSEDTGKTPSIVGDISVRKRSGRVRQVQIILGTDTPSCKIVYFKPRRIVIEPGQNAILSWNTNDCGVVGFESELVSTTGSKNTDPLTTKTTYTLYAADALLPGCQTFTGFSTVDRSACSGNALLKKVTIEVLSSNQYKCEILSLTTTPVFLGGFASIDWNTKQCLHVGLSEGTSLVFTGPEIQPTGSRFVGPLRQTTSYRMVAASTLPDGCTTLIGYSPLTGEVCTATAQTKVVTVEI